MTIVRELITVLGYDVDEEGAKRAEKIFEGLKKGAAFVVAGVGAVAGALTLVAKQTADAGDDIAKTSARLNISAKALQELEFAGSSAGIPVTNLRDSLKDLTKNLGEVARGNKTAAQNFAQMGVSVRDANGKIRSSEDVLGSIAEQFAKVKDPARQAALASSVMGESGAMLAPLLRQGQAGIQALREEAVKYGAVIDGPTLKASEDFQDAQQRLGVVITSLRNSLGGKLLPILIESANATRDWLLANRELVERGIKGTVEAVRSLLETAGRLARVIAENRRIITIFATVVLGSLLLVKVNALIVAFNALTFAQIRAAAIPIIMGAAFIALAAIIALVIEDVYEFVTGGESAIGNLLDVFVNEEAKPGDHWIVKTLRFIIKSTVEAIRFIERLTELAAGVAGFTDPFQTDPKTGQRRASLELDQAERDRVGAGSASALARIRGRAGGAVRAGAQAQALGATSFGGASPSPATAPSRATAPAAAPNVSVGGSTANITVTGGSSPDATADEVARRVRQVQEDDRRETARLLAAQGRIAR